MPGVSRSEWTFGVEGQDNHSQFNIQRHDENGAVSPHVVIVSYTSHGSSGTAYTDWLAILTANEAKSLMKLLQKHFVERGSGAQLLG